MIASKIIHIDMDAFMRPCSSDDPRLRANQLLSRGGDRSVVCCFVMKLESSACVPPAPLFDPRASVSNAIFRPPDFPRYRAVSRQVPKFSNPHHLIDPLSPPTILSRRFETRRTLPPHTSCTPHSPTDPHERAFDARQRSAEQIPREDCLC